MRKNKMSKINKLDLIAKKHFEMLYTSVRVRTSKAGGSGTVVYSEKDAEGIYHTYIVTNHHVIEDAIHVEKTYDPAVGMDRKVEKRDTVNVEFFYYDDFSKCTGSQAYRADIRAYTSHQKGYDLALLELKSHNKPVDYIANVFPKKTDRTIRVYDEVFAVGAALGHPPITTRGEIVSLDDETGGKNYFMSTASIIFGNSGGALFRYSESRDKFEYVGVPAMVSIVMLGFSAAPISHMGYVIPIDTVYKFLDKNYYQFIYDAEHTFESCEKARKTQHELAQKLILGKFGSVEQ